MNGIGEMSKYFKYLRKFRDVLDSFIAVEYRNEVRMVLSNNCFVIQIRIFEQDEKIEPGITIGKQVTFQEYGTEYFIKLSHASKWTLEEAKQDAQNFIGHSVNEGIKNYDN